MASVAHPPVDTTDEQRDDQEDKRGGARSNDKHPTPQKEASGFVPLISYSSSSSGTLPVYTQEDTANTSSAENFVLENPSSVTSDASYAVTSDVQEEAVANQGGSLYQGNTLSYPSSDVLSHITSAILTLASSSKISHSRTVKLLEDLADWIDAETLDYFGTRGGLLVTITTMQRFPQSRRVQRNALRILDAYCLDLSHPSPSCWLASWVSLGAVACVVATLETFPEDMVLTKQSISCLRLLLSTRTIPGCKLVGERAAQEFLSLEGHVCLFNAMHRFRRDDGILQQAVRLLSDLVLDRTSCVMLVESRQVNVIGALLEAKKKLIHSIQLQGMIDQAMEQLWEAIAT